MKPSNGKTEKQVKYSNQVESSNHQPKVEDENSILEIDDDRLEWEWGRQSGLMRTWTKRAAVRERDVNTAKDHLKLVYAQVERKLREDPTGYELPKTTDHVVEQYILLQDEYQEAQQELNDAKYRLALAQSMVEALHDKRRALENKVELFGLGYWSTPRLRSQNMTELRDQMEGADARETYRRGRREED